MKPRILDCMPTYGEVPITLFEDEDIVVLNKPAGWLTHHDGQDNRPSLTRWYPRPLGVHSRLDIDTTGVVAFSKTKHGHKRLASGFEQRQFVKTYLAVTHLSLIHI